MALKEAHSRKPDPDEPWRYVCPDCRVQVFDKPSTAAGTFRCKSGCQERWDRSELYDRKTGEQAIFTDKYD
jgi:hypothetical protein